MTKTKLAAAIVAANASVGAANVQAATVQTGDWSLSFGGNVNAFLTRTGCDGGDLDSGTTTLPSLACAGAVDADGDPADVTSITNGLLPASLNFGASTRQNGYDIAATLNVYYGSTSNTALGFSSVDARQLFFTIGTEDRGSFKLGRDFGLFGFDAIVGDMSLLGAGSAFSSGEPGHTTLGGLGYGYVYTDRLTQINYTTPNRNGLEATVGLFQPINGNGATSGSDPGLHGKLSYAFESRLKGKVSASFLQQSVVAGGEDADIEGMDLFLTLNFGKADLTAYLYDGEGMSTLALGGLVLPGFAADGQAEESSGKMLQGSYRFGDTKLGLSLMSSEQTKLTRVENSKTTFGVYHSLTPSLTLVGEYSAMESEMSDSGASDESTNLSLGAILFF